MIRTKPKVKNATLGTVQFLWDGGAGGIWGGGAREKSGPNGGGYKKNGEEEVGGGVSLNCITGNILMIYIK